MDILSRTHCLGASLIFLGLICIFANILLIFPNFEYQFLLQRKVSLYALMMSGLWGGGVLVFIAARQFLTKHSKPGFWRVRSTMLCSIPYSALGLLGSGICFVVNFTGLAKGPFCQYLNCDQEPSWGYPLQARSASEEHYIYNSTQWYTVCKEPRNVVVWNIFLFSIILLANILQALLCVIQIINGVAGVFFGTGNRHNKTSVLRTSGFLIFGCGIVSVLGAAVLNSLRQMYFDISLLKLSSSMENEIHCIMENPLHLWRIHCIH